MTLLAVGLALALVDPSGLPMLGFMLRHAGAGKPAMHRLRLAANMVVAGGAAIERGLMSHCLMTARMAERSVLVRKWASRCSNLPTFHGFEDREGNVHQRPPSTIGVWN